MVYMVNYIQEMIERKYNVSLVMLDLSSAFETVDHKLLIDRLENDFYISQGALQMITSYLDKRTFSVVIDEFESKPHFVNYGVPQGSILRPLFFSAYTQK